MRKIRVVLLALLALCSFSALAPSAFALLREADRMLAEGIEVPEVAKALEVSEPTYHRLACAIRWDEGRRREALEGAGAREHDVEADRRGQGAGERGVAGDREGKLLSPSRRRAAVLMLQDRLVLGASGVPDHGSAPLDTASRAPAGC